MSFLPYKVGKQVRCKHGRTISFSRQIGYVPTRYGSIDVDGSSIKHNLKHLSSTASVFAIHPLKCIIHQQQRWISATSILQHDSLGWGDAISSSSSDNMNDNNTIYQQQQQQLQKNKYITRTLYRQMIRWCQSNMKKYPNDIIQYYIPSRKEYRIPTELDAYRTELLQQSVDLYQHYTSDSSSTTRSSSSSMTWHRRDDTSILPLTTTGMTATDSNETSDDDDDDDDDDTVSNNDDETVSNDDDEETVKILEEFINSKEHIFDNKDQKDAQTVYNVLLILNQLQVRYNPNRLVFDLRTIHDIYCVIRALYRMNNVIPPDPIKDGIHVYETHLSYEKQRRTLAFEEMKHLNEISIELYKLDQQLIMHDQFYMTYPQSANNVIQIGQIVQHTKERWRGIVLNWTYSSDPMKKKLNTKISDDFTSLTSKPYELSPHITYEIALDNSYRVQYGQHHPTSLRVTNSSATPTCVTVIVPIHSNVNDDNIDNHDTHSVLQLVTDKQLCYIRSPIVADAFDNYDHNTNRYVPNTRLAYLYPKWNEVSSSYDNSNHDTIVDSQHDVNALINIPTEEANLLMTEMIQNTKDFATHLESIIVTTIGEDQLYDIHSDNDDDNDDDNIHDDTLMRRRLMKVLVGLHNDLQSISTVNVIGSRYGSLPLSRQFSVQLRALEYIAITIFETMLKRRAATTDIIQSIDVGQSQSHQFQLGDIVRHKKYGFRGVVVGRDAQPLYNVSRWDGLRDIPNAKELPFYRIVPDQQDCIEAFGGERPIRYVCEANLEECPRDRMFVNVDLDIGWTKLSDGSYQPPPFESFQYGHDFENDGGFEECMVSLENEINAWHCNSSRTTSSDSTMKNAIPVNRLLQLLRMMDNVEDASAIRETIKLIQKSHTDITIRSRLQLGIDAMVADNSTRARTIFRSIVHDDPTYIEGWNCLATSENFLSLHKEAFESAHKVLELNPNDFSAYTQLGILHYQNNEFKDAERCFRQCLKYDPWSIVSQKLSECIDLIAKENELDDKLSAFADSVAKQE